jgi:hypothetical protein
MFKLPTPMSNSKRTRKTRASKRSPIPGAPNRVERLLNSGSLRVTKRATSLGGIAIIPSSGLSISGVTTSPVIGMYFTQAGFIVYNTTVGPSVIDAFSYPGATNYTSIYDQFMISEVRVRAYFSNNYSSVGSVTSAIPLIYSAVDFDGASSPPTSASAVLSYENSVVHQQGSTTDRPFIDRKLIPRVVNNVTGNLVTSNAYGLLPECSYVDSTSAGNTAHWGMFFAYDPQSASSSTAIGYLTFVVDLTLNYRGDRS